MKTGPEPKTSQPIWIKYSEEEQNKNFCKVQNEIVTCAYDPTDNEVQVSSSLLTHYNLKLTSDNNETNLLHNGKKYEVHNQNFILKNK